MNAVFHDRSLWIGGWSGYNPLGRKVIANDQPKATPKPDESFWPGTPALPRHNRHNRYGGWGGSRVPPVKSAETPGMARKPNLMDCVRPPRFATFVPAIPGVFPRDDFHGLGHYSSNHVPNHGTTPESKLLFLGT
jgi:hypothetical protein